MSYLVKLAICFVTTFLLVETLLSTSKTTIGAIEQGGMSPGLHLGFPNPAGTGTAFLKVSLTAIVSKSLQFIGNKIENFDHFILPQNVRQSLFTR